MRTMIIILAAGLALSLAMPVTAQDAGKKASGDKKDSKEVLNVTGELTKKNAKKDGFFQKLHKVELAGGKKYTITLTSHKDKFFDTFLILQDAKGKTLAQNDDFGDSQASRIIYTPKETAQFQIIVTSFSEGETGKYTLKVTE